MASGFTFHTTKGPPMLDIRLLIVQDWEEQVQPSLNANLVKSSQMGDLNPARSKAVFVLNLINY